MWPSFLAGRRERAGGEDSLHESEPEERITVYPVGFRSYSENDMTTKPLTISYNLAHRATDAEAIEDLMENIRQKAIDLGFNPVGGLAFYAGDGDIISSPFGQRFLHPDLIPVPPLPLCVCYFVASLPDCDGIEIGLAAYPSEGSNLPVWRWSGIISTADIRLFTTLLHYAAEIGVLVSFAYAGLAVTYRLDDQGEFQCERKWLFDPDEW